MNNCFYTKALGMKRDTKGFFVESPRNNKRFLFVIPNFDCLVTAAGSYKRLSLADIH